MSAAGARPLVSCVTVFLNAERFLDEAIASVVAQGFDDWELLLVDDGSTDQSSSIAQAAAAGRSDQVRYLEHPGHANLGESASRNLGVREARGELLAFLDADDVLLPHAFEQGVAAIARRPDVALAYGRFERWYSWTGRAGDATRDAQSDPGVPLDARYEGPRLLATWMRNENAVPANCSVILRRDAVLQAGGFEEAFSRISGDDLVLYSKILSSQAAYVATGCWSRYRQHPDMSVAHAQRSGQWHPTRPNLVRQQYLTWLDGYLRQRGIAAPELRQELDRQLLPYRHATRYRAQAGIARASEPLRRSAMRLGRRLRGASTGRLVASPNPIRAADELGRGRTTLTWTTSGVRSIEVRVGGPDGQLFSRGGSSGSATTDDWVTDGMSFFLLDASPPGRSRPATLDAVTVRVSGAAAATGQAAADPVPRVGRVRLGDLGRVTPISRDWGYDRGTSIARWYIERFVAGRAADIRGAVLEIGDDSYTRRFGGSRVERSDVLNVIEGVPGTTIVADLADAPDIPSESFDCVVCIQTLQLIFDVAAAVRTLHRILKPGGVLLATVPGVAPTAGTWRDSTYWKLTPLSAQRLFGDVFGPGNVVVSGSGNALAAVAHVHGLAVEDLAEGSLDWVEPGYEVSIAVRAVKAPVAEG